MKFYAPVRPGMPPMYENTVPSFVIDDLSDLQGESNCRVALPIEVDWSSNPSYDVGNRSDAITMYETILRSARNEDLLARLINADILRDVWSELTIPKFIRDQWESTHPELV